LGASLAVARSTRQDFRGARYLIVTLPQAACRRTGSMPTMRDDMASKQSRLNASITFLRVDRIFNRLWLTGSAFLVQSFIPIVNAVLLGSLLYQSRLVPRALPVLGFIGATLLLAVWFAVLFGLTGAASAPAGIAGLVIAASEFSLGIYLTFRGFKPSPITADM
jgi:Domain of unknown function (DUF4386)